MWRRMAWIPVMAGCSQPSAVRTMATLQHHPDPADAVSLQLLHLHDHHFNLSYTCFGQFGVRKTFFVNNAD